MTILNNELDDGLLDGAGKSRRFVQADKLEDYIQKKQQNFSPKFPNSKDSYDSTISVVNNELSTADLIRIAAQYPQAIVKITSYGKGIFKIAKHLAYITRNYELPAEDQDQSLIQSKKEAKDLLSSWESIYFDQRKNSRDTVHIVFSVPPGTCRQTFKALTREFLIEEYCGKHDYLFVPHDDTEHPHIHAVISLRSLENEKLNPRKQYLASLRKRYAEKCRAHGVMVEASRRFERGFAGKSAKSSLVQIRKRNEIPSVDDALINRIKLELATNQQSDTGQDLRKLRNKTIKTKFFSTAKALFENYMASRESRSENELVAAKLLLDFSNKFPAELSRTELIKEQLKAKAASLGKSSNLSTSFSATIKKANLEGDLSMSTD